MNGYVSLLAVLQQEVLLLAGQERIGCTHLDKEKDPHYSKERDSEWKIFPLCLNNFFIIAIKHFYAHRRLSELPFKLNQGNCRIDTINEVQVLLSNNVVIGAVFLFSIESPDI